MYLSLVPWILKNMQAAFFPISKCIREPFCYVLLKSGRNLLVVSFLLVLSIKFAHQTGCVFWTMRLFAGMDFHELLDIPHGDRRKYHDDVTVMVVSLEGRIWKSSGKYLWENIRSTKTTCKLQRKLEYDRFVWGLYDLPSDAMRNQRDDDDGSS